MCNARAAAEKDPVSAVTKKARAWFQSNVDAAQFMQICISHRQISAIP
jgi:hypothetical protein